MGTFVAPVIILCVLLAAGILIFGAEDPEPPPGEDRGRENNRRGRQRRENDRNRRARQPPEANQHAQQPPPQAPPLGREVEDLEDRRGEARQLGRGAGGELTRRERVRYNEYGGEERQMEVMVLAPPARGCDCLIPAHIPRAGRAEADGLIHRHNGGRVGHNKCGRRISSQEPATQSGCGRLKDGSATASLQPQSCFYETHAALSLAQEDPTLEIRKLCGGNQTTREEHYTCMEKYLKNCEKDGGEFRCTQVTPICRCLF